MYLYDGRLPHRNSVWCGDSVASGDLGGDGGRLERRREVRGPLLRHLVVAGVEELLLEVLFGIITGHEQYV